MLRFPLNEINARQTYYPSIDTLSAHARKNGTLVTEVSTNFGNDAPRTIVFDLDAHLPRLVLIFDPQYPTRGMRGYTFADSRLEAAYTPEDVSRMRALMSHAHMDITAESNPAYVLNTFADVLYQHTTTGLQRHGAIARLAKAGRQIDCTTPGARRRARGGSDAIAGRGGVVCRVHLTTRGPKRELRTPVPPPTPTQP